MNNSLICQGCGAKIEENFANILEDYEEEGDVLCEGCAEDQLDSCRSQEADCRELGLDYSDEYCE